VRSLKLKRPRRDNVLPGQGYRTPQGTVTDDEDDDGDVEMVE
jgi:hypothetical protein